MAEESRGKRRKQANPRRNQVDIERVSSLGSEGEDEVGLWSLEPQDYQESLDKTSLTPSEGTEEPGSPVRSNRPHNLSPSSRNHWAEGGPEAEAEGEAVGEGESGVATLSARDRERDQGSRMMYSQTPDSQNALEDLAHYDFLVQLRKASNPASLPDHPHLTRNGTTNTHHPAKRHDDLPPAIWSPGAQHYSPEGPDGLPLSPDTLRTLQACPFCQRTYQRGASLREHIKYCQERDGGHMVCPLCGYTATYRAQMERHVALHNQMHDKNPVMFDQGIESRKFKCLQCGKAFKYKHHLKEHLRIHSGEKPYECSNCKKRFSHSGSYSSHLSSKKCLSGGGSGGGGSGGGGGGAFNGHSQGSYHHSSPTSPSAGGGRNSSGKGSPFPPQTQDSVRPLGQLPGDPQHDHHHHHHHLSPQENHHSPVTIPRGSDLARLWDPTAEISLRASVFKGTTLLPYLNSGAKFEQMLQEMLHREVKRNEGKGAETEEGKVSHNEGGRNGKASPDRALRGDRVRSGEGERGGVTCRWCSQLFPNVAVLMQHERYLCKMNREAVEMPEGPHSKDLLSPTLFFPRPSLQTTENHSRGGVVTNGLSKDNSPLLKSNWHSVPQQLLVAMHSPSQPRPDPRPYWPSQERMSPGQPISPSAELSSPQVRRRVPSTGFGSPLCLDLSSCPPDLSSPQNRSAPQNRTPGSAGSQNEPLDLSLPKQPSDQEARHKAVNSNPARGEKRELESQQLRRLSPTQSPHLPPHQHPVYSGARAPVFGGSMYSGFPLFNPMLQGGLGGSGHDSVPSLPLSRPANSPGFLSPMAYMMEADSEAMLKRIHQERQAMMGEVLSRGGLEYLSLMEDGMDVEGGLGRKRLKKTDEGLYACDICEKTFQKSSSLLRHKYEHTGKRPHECKICNKAFKHKHHLIEHSRLHSGEKPYQCDKCGKRFSHSGSYSQHMNHRYAYCSRDQDPDQDPEELLLTPGTDADLGGRGAGGTPPLSMEDTQTPHSFLSDSSLDGTPGGLREEEEEEEEEERSRDGGVEEPHMSLSGDGDGGGLGLELASSAKAESPPRENGEQTDRDSGQVGNHVGSNSVENHLWDRDTVEHNGDSHKYERSLEATASQ